MTDTQRPGARVPEKPTLDGLEDRWTRGGAGRNVVELCEGRTAEAEKVSEDVWRTVGLSVDWAQRYTTIDERSRTASQRGFLRNLARGEAYPAEAPTLWDVSFGTAV